MDAGVPLLWRRKISAGHRPIFGSSLTEAPSAALEAGLQIDDTPRHGMDRMHHFYVGEL
jgi:hypothetical protein